MTSKLLATVEKALLKLILKSISKFPKVSKFENENDCPEIRTFMFSFPLVLGSFVSN